LKTCPVCKRVVDSEVERCPHCGYTFTFLEEFQPDPARERNPATKPERLASSVPPLFVSSYDPVKTAIGIFGAVVLSVLGLGSFLVAGGLTSDGLPFLAIGALLVLGALAVLLALRRARARAKRFIFYEDHIEVTESKRMVGEYSFSDLESAQVMNYTWAQAAPNKYSGGGPRPSVILRVYRRTAESAGHEQDVLFVYGNPYNKNLKMRLSQWLDQKVNKRNS
jgi:hypothetical protein